MAKQGASGAEIGAVNVGLYANTAPLKQGLGEAKAATQETAATMEQAAAGGVAGLNSGLRESAHALHESTGGLHLLERAVRGLAHSIIGIPALLLLIVEPIKLLGELQDKLNEKARRSK